MLTASGRTPQVDKKFDGDVVEQPFTNHLFLRLVAKNRHFTKVDFSFSIFDTCYLRGCTFDSCNFTGCRFTGTNLHGATFSGCKFDYAIFERTTIDNAVLDTECPGFENLKLWFARTLRMNYQQMGDAQSVNKAIAVELAATEVHLHKAWQSNESYYRAKYAGRKRARAFGEWAIFWLLGFIWGNGESPPRLIRTALLILLLMTFLGAVFFKDWTMAKSYIDAAAEAPQVLLGTLSSPHYPTSYLTLLVLVRLVLIGLFITTIVKRLGRR